MKQSEFETLMMAHDNLQRELADIKRLMGKDKHALIKANIAFNKRVQELEKRLKIYQKRSWFEDYERVAKQNKRYRKALEKIARVNIEQGTVTVSEVHAVLT